jgi:hypothetical protein
MGTPVENVKIVGFDIVQNAFIKHRRCSHSKTAVGMKQCNTRHSLGIQTAGAGNLKAHKITPAPVYPSSSYILLVKAKCCQLILRKVATTGIPILPDIAQDIRKL